MYHLRHRGKISNANGHAFPQNRFANEVSKPLLQDFEIKMLLSFKGGRDFNLGSALGT